MRQNAIEPMELALDSRDEAPRSQCSGEAPTTSHEDERSGGEV
jgi:hypothetical protein